jgi:uncharacterized repeat protein (TIGR01451 family)
LAGSLLAQQVVANTASATYQTVGGTDSVISNPVQTVVLRPLALLQKSLVGPAIAHIGETVQYQLDYGNGSTAAALTGAVLTDSLPIGFDFVSAQPAAGVAGRVLQWSLGDLAPGASGQVRITLVVSATVTDTQRVRNAASLASLNASSQVAIASEVRLIGPPSRALALTKSADVLEAGLGETAPFTLAVSNAGTLPLADIRVVDRLPAGMRFAQGSMSGADSVRSSGQTLTFFVPGPLAPGEVHRVRYASAVVSATAQVLTNTAVATAEAGAVQSAESRAWVRLRQTDPMATRAAIGKVWVDLNGNGVQDPEDPGVEGVEVWTPDGEVATTDRDGRFSYRNLRIGQHGFRLDPASLPPEYRLAEDRNNRELVVRDATGWTTPRVEFRLLSRGASLADVALPVTWRFTALSPPATPPPDSGRGDQRHVADAAPVGAATAVSSGVVTRPEIGSEQPGSQPGAMVQVQVGAIPAASGAQEAAVPHLPTASNSVGPAPSGVPAPLPRGAAVGGLAQGTTSNAPGGANEGISPRRVIGPDSVFVQSRPDTALAVSPRRSEASSVTGVGVQSVGGGVPAAQGSGVNSAATQPQPDSVPPGASSRADTLAMVGAAVRREGAAAWPRLPDSAPGASDSAIGSRSAISSVPDSALDGAVADSTPAAATLDTIRIYFAFRRTRLTPESRRTLKRAADMLIAHPGRRFEVTGHTDSIGSVRFNVWFGLERARAVLGFLARAGVDTARARSASHGPLEPLATNATPAGRALNRRVEILVLLDSAVQGTAANEDTAHARPTTGKPMSGGPAGDARARKVKGDDTIEERPAPTWTWRADSIPNHPEMIYEITVENRYDQAIGGLMLRFNAVLDSAQVAVGDSVAPHAGGAWVSLPELPPQSHATVRVWPRGALDSSGVALGRVTVLEGERGRDSVVRLSAEPWGHATGLPAPAAVPATASVRVSLAPPPSGWPDEAVWRLATGWEMVSGSSRIGGRAISDPLVTTDASYGTLLRWPKLESRRDSLQLELRPVSGTVAVETVRVPALRTEESRGEEQRRSLVAGPGVEVFAPTDGTVLRTDRLYVGVRGEANAPVTLFDGDSVLAEARMRIDGMYDFIAVALTPGPHRLRVRIANSWGQERWDSLSVHVTGLPARFAAQDSAVELVADGRSDKPVRVRVLDRWGVPVVNGPFVTVAGAGAAPINPDADASSVGLQLQADAAGWIAVRLKPGTEVRPGRLTLSSGDARGVIRLDLLPAVGPLFVTGVGQVGVGAAPGTYGALTARGRLDRRTTFRVSYDSRHLDEGRSNFGRSYDPLEEAQYPILGDAGRTRSVGASRYQLSARVERGYDWLAYGDISTTGFGEGLRLTSYQRALPGAAGRVTSGPLQWQGFFSSTRQSAQQLQLRGQGTSGPYNIGADIAAGTEQVRLESRDADNPERIVTQQVLSRYVDYEIDYQAGTLLLKQPVPAADTYGNPVFIVVTFESQSGGARHDTWGLRLVGDAARVLRRGEGDSLALGVTAIHDGAGNGARSLSGFDVRLRERHGVGLRGELSRSDGADSTGLAASLDGSLELFRGSLLVSGGWMRIGDRYRNPANLALQGGSEEFRFGSRFRAGASDLKLEHEEQSFATAGVTRRRTAGGVTRSFGPEVKLEALLTDEHAEAGGTSDGSTAGEGKLTWTPVSRLNLWAEGRRQLATEGSLVRPDYVGGGAAFKVTPAVSLEARERWVMLGARGADYSITNLGLRAQVAAGTEAWSSYQLAGVDGKYNAAVVGLSNRLTLGQSWALNALVERRVGLGNAAITDPARAAPFLQPEEDYWSAGVGAEFLPQSAPYRLSARGELRDGSLRSSRLLTVAGDASVTPSLAVLSRQEFMRSEQRPSGTTLTTRQYNSLWGVALRPTRNGRLNLLGKFQWVRGTNPGGTGVLTGQGDEDRVIGALEGIWAPTGPSEFALRFAVRRTASSVVTPDSASRQLRSFGEFIGWRARYDLVRRFGVRSDARLLLERTSSTSRWDLAPQLYFLPVPVLEVATGYRFGNLRDPDFAVDGGQGWFVTFGARLTEQSLSDAAAFWRHRLGAP